MLDQNTDRMWYVIGAVIIGAAIILILNNTFPQLFASVGETFKGKTEQTTEVVDGIMPHGIINTGLVIDGANPEGHIRSGYHVTYGGFSLSEKIVHGDRVNITLQIAEMKDSTTLIGVYADMNEFDTDATLEQIVLIPREDIDENGRVTVQATWKNSRDLDQQNIRLYTYPNRISQNAGFTLDWVGVTKVKK